MDKKSPGCKKDQSYMLWSVRQEHLARTIFPLADSQATVAQ
ncbi:MAG: hypothetical protein IPP80_13900 [Ignavibacteria bacterium]|nr:hypothetical protein [Ignavibacteria bacterium]